MKRRVLVIEDDRKTAETIGLYLEHAGHEATLERDGTRGLDRALSSTWDLILLDVMLPGLDGLEICRQLRETAAAPVIMITALGQEEALVRGLDAGADDYVTKPFSPRELMARVRAVLRRSVRQEAGGAELLRFGDLEIDLLGHRARVAGEAVSLTPTEFRLLRQLAASPGRVYARAELIERALGLGFDGQDRTIDAHVKNLRRKLRPAGERLIETVFGVGYRFVAPDAEVS